MKNLENVTNKTFINWLKFKLSKRSNKNVFDNELPETIQFISREKPIPIYSIDLNEHGNFVLFLIHVTSSVNIKSILEKGLLPLTDLRKNLLDYLLHVFPNDNPSDLLSAIERSKSSNSILVRGRLINEDSNKPIIFLLPIKSEAYLGSAAENGITDGGEFFKAARKEINDLFKKNVEARYPKSQPVVFVCKLLLELNGTILRAVINDEIIIDAKTMSDKDLNCESEFRIYSNINPELLSYFNLDDYLKCEKHYISEAAEIKLKEILNSQS